jgi:hypothetical protein
VRALAVVILAVVVAAIPVAAQRGGREAAPAVGAAQAGSSAGRGARAAAPFDPTGYWVSLVSDEWRYRMLTPPKGNVDYVPVTPEARRVANEWDPAKDEAAGEQCRGYGAGGIMRLPVRLHITWADERTLRIDIDAGTQTRLLHFGGEAPSSAEPTWQGFSAAEWAIPGAGRGRGPQPPPMFGQLKVVTTHLRPGYLRKNGVPYGANAVLTEYFQHLNDDGTEYLAVTSLLEDPQYLAQPWVRTSQFRKQPDARGWNPTPCSTP